MTKKDRYWNKKGPDDGRAGWDYIVIGSGMGGMTSAALLAKAGKRVLVIEQHYVPGGFTHMFKRPGYEWDVGVHAVGEVTMHSMPGRLLHALTDGDLRWASLGPVYDEFYFPDDFRIDFPSSPKQFQANLEAAFPNGREAISGYLAKVKEAASSMKAYYLARTLPRQLGQLADRTIARKAQRILTQNTKATLDALSDDPKLKAVLAAQWGYYGSVPSRSSWAIQALVVKHFQWGGFYPVGGAKEIARTLLKTVSAAGGWTRISTDVDQILIENGRAVGVRLSTGEEIRAGRVISAAGVSATVNRLLPEYYRNAAWADSITKLPAAPAHVCLYLGFKGDIRKAGASAANKWFYNTWSTESDTFNFSADHVDQADVLYCSFPSLKDPKHDPGPEQRHTGEVVTFVPWEVFEKWQASRWKKRPEDYDEIKKALHDALLEQFLKRMPDLKPMLDVSELSTPLSTDNFVRPMKGSIYGLEPTPERFRNPYLRPRSPIRGLFFSGSEVATVGVVGAMMGGALAAMSAEPIAVGRFVRTIM